jgi:methyl-accepting chemotaxis protein
MMVGFPQPTSAPLIEEDSLEAFLRLEQALDGSLQTVIGDTESSAQGIIQHIRKLHDSASTLVTYLDGTNAQAGDLGRDIVESVDVLADIGAFMEKLPAKMQSDLTSVQAVVKEIKALADMTSDVQAISLQSHLLAINAAIEASRAGASGAAFKVVADEMRKLAANSSAMAVRINQGLTRARDLVETGMESTITDSSRQFADVSKATSSIHKLRDNFEDISQYYKTRFAIVTKHNQDLVVDIAEVLGHIQYQDVVRQTIERIRIAAERRNAALSAALEGGGPPDVAGRVDRGDAADAPLPQQLELILDDYLTEEHKHRHSARHAEAAGAPPKIELF